MLVCYDSLIVNTVYTVNGIITEADESKLIQGKIDNFPNFSYDFIDEIFSVFLLKRLGNVENSLANRLNETFYF